MANSKTNTGTLGAAISFFISGIWRQNEQVLGEGIYSE